MDRIWIEFKVNCIESVRMVFTGFHCLVLMIKDNC